MKKITYLSLFSALVIGLTYNSAMGLTTPDYPYYNCPSMEKYSPALTASAYCVRTQTMKPSEYSQCLREYKKKFDPVKNEYKNRQCKLSDVRYTELRFGTTSCKVEYTTKPEAQIISVENIGAAEARCSQRLIHALKRAYPNIK